MCTQAQKHSHMHTPSTTQHSTAQHTQLHHTTSTAHCQGPISCTAATLHPAHTTTPLTTCPGPPQNAGRRPSSAMLRHSHTCHKKLINSEIN